MTPESTITSFRSAASATLDAVVHRLYVKRRSLFGLRRGPFGRRYEHLWPFANAWSALGTWASISGPRQTSEVLDSFPTGLAAYHPRGLAALSSGGPVSFDSSVARQARGPGEVYFDDNAWLGLALVHHHDISADARALRLAHRLFDFLVSGWSADDSWSHPGGIRWKLSPADTTRNTCSNAPGAELGALLHEHTGCEEALQWALRIYEWVRATLRGPGGLYRDRISPEGDVESTIWSYNQGTMIGAGVLLHRVTGDGTYLEQASETAAASLAHFGVDSLVGQGAAFNAVFFRNLFLLNQVAPNFSYGALASAFATAMWERCRDARTGLFLAGGSPLNASAPMIEVYALLAGAQPHA